MTEPSSSQVVAIEISDLAMPRDLGVGRFENRVVFVPGAVPGDKVRVELVRGSKGLTYGRLMEVEDPSPWRRDPPCPHFGSCGGCSLLHLEYERQLEIKSRHLSETLRRVGGLRVDPDIVVPITPSVHEFYYRGKIELAYIRQGDENLLGLRRRLSPFGPYTGEVVPIESCAIFSTSLDLILPVLRRYIEEFEVPVFDERTRRGFLKGVTIRESKSTGDLMVILETSKGQPRGVESLDLLRQQSITGACVAPSTGRGGEPFPSRGRSCWISAGASPGESTAGVKSISRIQDGRGETLAGQGWIEEIVDDLRFRIFPAAFFQPNPKTAGLLYGKVLEFARSIGAGRIIGLYCGMGSLEMMLSRSVERVEGYDADPANIGNARRNCKSNGLTNCRFYVKRIEDIVFRDVPRSFDLAVIDPPRTGMSKTALQSVVNMGLPAIAYISCDPATLARDLKALVPGGYGMVQVMPFDFFPHTSHLETLVFLRKK